MKKNGFRNTPLLKVELATRNFIVRTLQRLGLNLEPLTAPAGHPRQPLGYHADANEKNNSPAAAMPTDHACRRGDV